ncbi:MAG: cytochrome c [Sulfuricaulis sp.]|uniref:c-type cytochrome n=1 Tax=Sulfuricaulis sp. TaxID=2003553 RepID=UPI0025FC6E8A|nr:cytochrome c [Sulfuricaulis sp.]MCR4346220.1 cytochrome c [Sulfuricaulis sp.]
MNKFLLKATLLSAVLLISACSEQKSTSSAASKPDTGPAEVLTPLPKPVSVGRNQDFSTMMRGAKLYQENCAVCHGPQAEGAPNWQRKGPDGKLLPPPLNGAGHAWHHPGTWIRDMIKQGSVNRGGNMPSWDGKLSDDDIEAVIVWIQSRWPDEIYQSWLAMDEKARQGAGNR